MILDHGGNVDRHGLPHEDREWSLTKKPKRVSGVQPDPYLRRKSVHTAVLGAGGARHSRYGLGATASGLPFVALVADRDDA